MCTRWPRLLALAGGLAAAGAAGGCWSMFNREDPARDAGLTAPYEARTADLNRDGFTTLDEVVALRDAGLGDAEMIEWIGRSHQVFRLNHGQRRYLLDHGVSEDVIDAMDKMR